MNAYLTHTLSNGLQVVHCPHAGNVAYCGFIVNAGTRDEAADEFGLAHLVEHTIFKGTAHRRAYHIRNRMESVGGELNAFTSKEETVIYSIFPSQYQERAMELLGDLVIN
ncbi:MAG: insulinase family protein, partial [Bacteroidales bacterium]|nr:insulinase family protein [Bacteroidales bacterium]